MSDILTFTTPPEYQGQIVEISFACDEDGIYRRTFDRDDWTVKMEFAKWRKNDKAEFDPWNHAPNEKRRWAIMRPTES